LMLPHRSVVAGVFLVAIVFPPWFEMKWLSHEQRRAHAHFRRKREGRHPQSMCQEDQAARVIRKPGASGALRRYCRLALDGYDNRPMRKVSGPRLKSVNRIVLLVACFWKGFPSFLCRTVS